MNNSPKFLKIDDRLGRRMIKSEHEMHDDESNINWNIQQQNEQSTVGKNFYTNHRKFTIESDQQNTKFEHYNRFSSINVNKSNNQCNCYYSNRISQIVNDVDMSKKFKSQINEEIKYMRQMLQQLNDELSGRLNRYKLTNITPKGMAVAYESQIQAEILLSKMENNIKFIEVQQIQIREMQGRERLVSDRDYQLELEEELSFTEREICCRKKEKQMQGILVNKLDGRLGSIKEPQLAKEFKNINVMKHNILHYYKKYRQNKVIIQQVDRNYANMIEKDRKLTVKFNDCFKMAEENNLAVKANKNYMEYLKQRDELKAKKEYLKKKVQVETRSRQFQCQKLQKQIQFLKKQLSTVEKRQELAESKCEETLQITDEYMQKYKIDKKLISKISYKFSDISLKSSRQKSINDNTESLDKNETETQQKKPQSRLKFQIQKQLSSPIGIIKTPIGRYQTLAIDQTFTTKKLEVKVDQNRDKQFRIKPTLYIKKKIDKSSKAQSSMTQSICQSGKSNDEEINIKMRKLHKILVKKNGEKDSN